MMKLFKTFGAYKNYGSSFYKVWFEAFINYILIMFLLFEAIAFYFQADLTQFYDLVPQLSEIQNGKELLFSQVMEANS